SEGPNGRSNFAHLANPPFGSDFMVPVLEPGQAIPVSRLDVAILSDLDFPILPNPVFNPPPPRLLQQAVRTSLIAVGADAGGAPIVNVYNAQNPSVVVGSFLAFPQTFTGGVRVALGDVNGDGTLDIICGAGPGALPEVRVFDGVTFQPIMQFVPLPSIFAGGVWVAAGDVSGDGRADIVTSADRGGGPQVTITSGADSSIIAS